MMYSGIFDLYDKELKYNKGSEKVMLSRIALAKVAPRVIPKNKTKFATNSRSTGYVIDKSFTVWHMSDQTVIS